MIKHIQIVNFGGIENATVDCGKFNIFQGNSDQGKSTFLEAVKWAIVGGNDDYLIRNGTNTCEVILHSDNGSRIERRLTRGGTNKLFVYKNEEALPQPQSILNKLYDSFAFSPTAMVNMKAKDLNEFIRSAISSRLKLTPEEIKEYKLENVDLGSNPVEAIERHRKTLYDQRTEVNRSVSVMSARKVEIVDVKPEDIINTEERIAGLNNLISKGKDHNAKIEVGKKNQLARTNTAALIDKLKKEINGLNFTATEVAEFVNSKTLKQNQFNKMQLELSAERTKVATIKDTLAKMESGQIQCPIFGKIVCTTDMSSYKEALKKEQDDITTSGKKKFADSEKLQKEITFLTEKIDIHKDSEQKKLELSRAEALYQNLEISDAELVDVEGLEQQLQVQNELLSKYKISLEMGKVSGLEDLQKRQDELDKNVKSLDKLLKDVIPGKLVMGVKDVTLGKEGVFFRGLPLYRLASSIKLRICTSILKDLFPKGNLYNLDGMECISTDQMIKYINYYSKLDDGVQYFCSLVGRADFSGNNKVKLFNVENFKLV